MTQTIQAESLRGWYPKELLARARQESLDAFKRWYKSPLALVVVLETADSDLAVGLNTGASSERDGLPFRTATVEGGQDVPRGGRRLSLVPPSGHAELQRLHELASLSCHVVPLRKRAEGSFLASISVGRARNHDIVLRHTSVSKFHANLEVEGDRLFVKDAGSRNHTFLNHERVNSRVEVRAGDNLRFGWVEALVVSDQALWTAIRAV